MKVHVLAVAALLALVAVVAYAQNATSPADPNQAGSFTSISSSGPLTTTGPNTLGGATSLGGHANGQDAGFNRVAASTGFHTLNTGADFRFNGTTGPGFGYGGAATVQTLAGVSFSMAGTELESQGNTDTWGQFENDANGANCSGNTGSACTNDPQGDCTANGSGTTMSCTRVDGFITMVTTDSTGTPGAATINKPMGRSSVANGAASVTITNSGITATSTVLITPMASSATNCAGWYVSAVGASSFTLTCPGGVVGADWPFAWVAIPVTAQ